MEKSESIKELASALNGVQKTIQAAKKDSVNPYFKSKYAGLLSVWNACRGPLTDHGLSVAQVADIDSEGRPVLETILMHISGEWIKGRLPLSTVKTDPQGQGSAITYARRYSLSAIVGLCTEEDDDGEGSVDRGKLKKQGTQQKPSKTAPSETPPWDDRSETPSLIDMAWLKESLEELNWANVGKWLKGKYRNAKGVTVKDVVASLTPEQQKEFVQQVQTRLDIHGGTIEEGNEE